MLVSIILVGSVFILTMLYFIIALFKTCFVHKACLRYNKQVAKYRIDTLERSIKDHDNLPSYDEMLGWMEDQFLLSLNPFLFKKDFAKDKRFWKIWNYKGEK